MLSTSLEFREKAAESTDVALKATLTLADGTVRELTGADFMMGSASFSDAVSSDGSFDVGAAVMGRFDVTLNNFDRSFDEYDFTGATIVPYVGIELGAGGVEWIRKGVYNVEQPGSYGGTIALECLDNMSLLEQPYSDVTATVYPATLGAIVAGICSACGAPLKSASFANNGFTVAMRPVDDALSCRDVVAYAAQASGNFARFDEWGRLELKWYDTSAFEDEDWLDGGAFDESAPYSTGDAADGGNFMDYSSGQAADGGPFGLRAFAYVHAVSELTVCTDDVVITGVSVTAQDQVREDGTMGAEGETALYGAEGYVVGIAGNPLVQYGRAAAVAEQVGLRVAGMRFRPFDAQALGDPAVEAGDPAIVADRRGNHYRAYITSLIYRIGGYETFSCGAETPARNSAASYSALTKAIVASRKRAKAEMTSREAALQMLQMMLGGAAGLYRTASVQQDGSSVYYLHDKPTLGSSRTIWKATADAFGVSTDGGATYNYGIDSNGVAILNQIYAVGLDADYITGGTIASRNGLLSLNLDTGVMSAGGGSSLGGKTVSAILDDVDTANANASSAVSTANATAALVRTYGSGVLVCRQGNAVGALVNADGSFDVVRVTWSDGVPTAGAALASFGDSVEFGDGSNGLRFGTVGNTYQILYNLDGEEAFSVSYQPASSSGGTNWKMQLDFMLGLLQSYATGSANYLASNGYPLVFKDGGSLKYWDGTSQTPKPFAGHDTLFTSGSSTGSSLPIDLNKSAANYEYMRINYTFNIIDEAGFCESSVVVRNPNGKNVHLFGSGPCAGNGVEICTLWASVNGTRLSSNRGRTMTIYDNDTQEYASGANIYIRSVEAWNGI